MKPSRKSANLRLCLLTGLVACSDSSERIGQQGVNNAPPPVERIEDVASQSEPFVSTGIERVIPVRVVQLTSGGTALVNVEKLGIAINNANIALRPAGVQLYIKSIEKYNTPELVKIGKTTDTNTTWNTSLWNDFKQIYPSVPSSYPRTGIVANRDIWLQIVSIDYAEATDIQWFITNNYDLGGFGWFPWRGRHIISGYTMLDAPDLAWNTAHEFGHYLGLTHTFPKNSSDCDFYDISNPSTVWARDPTTNTAQSKGDYWDLVHSFDGTALKFFSNKSSTSGWTLKAKDEDFFHCEIQTPGCNTRCRSSFNNADYYTTTSSLAEGVGLSLAPSPNLGYNLMGYGNDPGVCPRAISPSQIEQIRRVMRYDIEIDGYPTRTGLRPLLGQHVGRNRVRDVDIDGDGYQDITRVRQRLRASLPRQHEQRGPVW